MTDPAHPHQIVAASLVTDVPTARPDERVEALRARLLGRRYADASHVFLVNDDARLAGMVPIADVLGADPQAQLVSLASRDGAGVVTLDMDREDAASRAIHLGVAVLGVCDANGRFVGIIPAAALIATLRDEHLEDLHHMAGILGKSEAAKAALAAPPSRRALYRLPWLLVGLVGSAAATAVMARFESVIAGHIAIAFFVPALVYLADAIGTQSEAVAVRSLSLTSGDLIPLLAGEIGTGVLMGAALGAVALPLVWAVFGSFSLAASVAIALAAASSVATAIGFLLPALFAKLGYDPALGAGPVATVVQDVLTLLIYFTIASALVL